MSIPGQPPPSVVLQKALDLHAAGQPDEAEQAVRRAALNAKAQTGSDSHALARAYADIARLHYHAGNVKQAATEFRHACDKPLAADPEGRRDRLAFMFGFGASLETLGKFDEAEKVYRKCSDFARGLHGPNAPGYAQSLQPLADLLLRTGKAEEAAIPANEAYDILWRHGDPGLVAVVGTRAECLKAVGAMADPFADLMELPDDLVMAVVAGVVGRAAGDGVRHRRVLADLLAFVDRKYGGGHPTTADILAAVAHHEATLGDRADPAVRAAATRRAVWSFAVRQVKADLLANLEVRFEPEGTIHVVPHLARDADAAEVGQLADVLTQALDDLYARARRKV